MSFKQVIFERMLSLEDELVIKGTRSSGPGGQNVNKVSSAAELRWKLAETQLFTEREVNKLQVKLKNIMNRNGVVVIRSETSRDFVKNKRDVVEKLKLKIFQSLQPVKKRIATRPTRSAVKKRLESKSKKSEKKQSRKKVEH